MSQSSGPIKGPSRPVLERAVRRRVESRANITLWQQCRVHELLPTPNGEAVTDMRSRTATAKARPLWGFACAAIATMTIKAIEFLPNGRASIVWLISQ